MNAPDDIDDINTPEGLIAGWLEYMAVICDGALESGDITSDEHKSLSNYLRFIQEDVESGCCTDAVMNTSSFWGYLHALQIPSIEKEALSLSARDAANARHKLPMPTAQALKKEFTRLHQELAIKNGTEPRPTSVYKIISKAQWDTEKYWRRIRTQVEKKPSK